MTVDTEAALRFLRTAYEPDDWIAIFLKSYETSRTAQRVGPLALFLQPRLHAWLRAMNAQRFNIYVSVNAITPGVRARTKDAIGAVRHVFLEADHDGPQLLNTLASRSDLPRVSYALESSPHRVHVFWRVAGFTNGTIEPLQKYLAAEFHTDPAATACSQTTRLPGYRNHRNDPSHLVVIEYHDAGARHVPEDFPTPPQKAHPAAGSSLTASQPALLNPLDRARRYLARVEPAIVGQHGDLHTFRVCCRMVRGFALDEEQAMAALVEWNARCSPPWTEEELRVKISNARRYGPSASAGCKNALNRSIDSIRDYVRRDPSANHFLNTIDAQFRVALDLVLPDADNQPPFTAEFPKVAPVTLAVLLNFVFPVRGEFVLPRREAPPMPIVPINKNNDPSSNEHEIWTTGKLRIVLPKSETASVRELSNS